VGKDGSYLLKGIKGLDQAGDALKRIKGMLATADARVKALPQYK
jgi:hypothetical protein